MIEVITAEIQIESRACNSNVITGDNAGNGDNQRNSNTSIDREVHHLMYVCVCICLVSSVPRRDAIDY